MPAARADSVSKELMKSFSKMLTFVSLIGGLAGLAGSVGTYFVTQYRVAASEKLVEQNRVEMKAEIAEVKTGLSANRDEVNGQAKMLIRLEERIKSLQRAQGIPTE
jgi:hypothetical protein